jgi:hypothetical protein
MPEDPTHYIFKFPSYLPAHLAPLLLGRIVKNFANPTADFVPHDPSLFTDSATTLPIDIAFHNVEALLSSDSTASLSAKLQDIACYSLHRARNASVSFSSSSIRRISLQQQGLTFGRMLRDADINSTLRSWLTAGGAPAFMIVGLCIWEEDTEMDEEETTEQEASAAATAPTGQAGAAALTGGAFSTAAAAAAAVTANSSSMTGDLSAEAQFRQKATRYIRASTQGKQIFAIECRKVYRSFTSVLSNTAAAAYLSSHGPRYASERQFAGNADQNATGAAAQGPPPPQDPPELDTDEEMPWTDGLEKWRRQGQEGQDQQLFPELEVTHVGDLYFATDV